MDGVFRNIMEGVKVERNENDYINDAGELVCWKCDGRKEVIIKNYLNSGKSKKVGCVCKCEAEAQERMDKQNNERILKLTLEKNRNRLLSTNKYINCRFDSSVGANEKLFSICKNYAVNFDEFKKTGVGLLLYGNTGSGKTYMASAIANELVDNGYTAMVEQIANLIDRMFKDKESVMSDIINCDLVVFDDFGIERTSEYSLEQMFKIIDARNNTGKPTIYTTNLTPEILHNVTDTSLQRIYGRVIENNIPIKVVGVNRRQQVNQEVMNDALKKLGIR